MSRKKPAGPLETFIAIAVCFVVMALLTAAIGMQNKETASSPSQSSSPSDTNSPPHSADAPELTRQYCNTVTPPDHPDIDKQGWREVENCVNIAYYCREIRNRPYASHYEDCKRYGYFNP